MPALSGFELLGFTLLDERLRSRGARLAVLAYRTHDVCERFTGWTVAMQQLKRLAIMCANADLQPNRLRVRIGDDAAHLQTIDLAGEYTVFDDRVGAAISNQLLECGVLAR